MVLSLALLLSCVSGITLFTAAEELPAPFGYFNFTGTDGATVANGSGACVRYITTDVDDGQIKDTNIGIETGTAIGDTGLYGHTVNVAYEGLYFGGTLLSSVPDGTDIIYAVEYYIDSAEPLEGNQLLVNGDNGDVLYSNLLVGQVGVVLYRLPAAKVDAIQANEWGGDTRVRIKILGEAVGKLYVTGAKILNAQYAVPSDPGYAYYDLGSKGACPYYPDTPVMMTHNVVVSDLETNSVDYPDRPWLYRYVKLADELLSGDRTVNKPVYLKAYAAEGHENATVAVGAYEYSNGTTSGFSDVLGVPALTIQFTNGVGGVYIPAACLNNNLNGNNSLRFWWEEAVKIARLEIYDVATYCDEANATAEMKELLHNNMLATMTNVTKDGYQKPTFEAPGETGTVTCHTCGEKLADSQEIPQLQTYAKLDFSTGTFVGTGANAAGFDIQPIPGTEYYGAQLNKQNKNFTFNLTEDFVVEADDYAITYEYYATSAWANDHRVGLVGNGYTLAINGGGVDNVWDSLPLNVGQPLVREQLGVVSFTVGANSAITAAHNGDIGGDTPAVAGNVYSTQSQADALKAGSGFTIICWNNDDLAEQNRAIYLKSITIHDAADLNDVDGTDPGYYYVDYEGVAIDPLYPDYKVQANYGISTSTGTAEHYPEDTDKEYVRFDYMYVVMPNELLSDAETVKATPVKLVIERKEGSTIDHIYYQYQIGGPADTWSSNCYVDFNEEGVYETTLWDARFFNSLNGGSSIRMRDTVYEQKKDEKTGEILGYEEVTGDEFEGIKSIKIYDLSKDCVLYHDHDEFTEQSGNLIWVGRVDPTYEAAGNSGTLKCAHCGEVFKQGEELPKLGEYVKFDFSDGTVKLQGVRSFTANDGNTSLVPVQIPGTDVYGLKLGVHNSGLKFNLAPFGGFDVNSVVGGQKIAVSVEYYIPSNVDSGCRIMFDPMAGSDKFMALYSNYSGTTWDASVLNPTNPLTRDALNVVTFVVGADVDYVTGPGKFGENTFEEPKTVNTAEFATALVSGTDMRIISWGVAEDKPVYIKSITIYDAEKVAEREEIESNMDFIDFESEFAECPDYYPDYTVKGYADGLICAVVDETGEKDEHPVVYAYFSVTRALIAADEEKHPVMIRFTFKEDCELTAFGWSYQGVKYDGTNGAAVWVHLSTDIVDNVAEVLLEDAVFENKLNSKGSFRLSNDATHGFTVDNLAKVEVLAVVDKSELETIVANTDEITKYKTPETVKAYKTVVEKAEAVLANGWATEADVAEAIAALEAAKANLVDCAHANGTTLVGAKDETCLEDGYTGDKACVICGFVAEGDKGTKIEKHKTETRNAREDSCKEPGYSGDLWCTVCNLVAKEGVYGVALPHTWDEGKVTKPATPNERGEKTKTCTVCGDTIITYFDFTGMLGDVSGDNKIDFTDARLILQFAVKKISGSELDTVLADVNEDGKIDSTDARLVLQYAVGKIDVFPKA